MCSVLCSILFTSWPHCPKMTGQQGYSDQPVTQLSRQGRVTSGYMPSKLYRHRPHCSTLCWRSAFKWLHQWGVHCDLWQTVQLEQYLVLPIGKLYIGKHCVACFVQIIVHTCCDECLKYFTKKAKVLWQGWLDYKMLHGGSSLRKTICKVRCIMRHNEDFWIDHLFFTNSKRDKMFF